MSTTILGTKNIWENRIALRKFRKTKILYDALHLLYIYSLEDCQIVLMNEGIGCTVIEVEDMLEILVVNGMVEERPNGWVKVP